MTEEEKFQRIDDYVNGHLSDEQQAIFNQELQNNPQLAEELELHQDLLVGINNAIKIDRAIDNELKLHLTELEKKTAVKEENKTELKTATVRHLNYYWLSGAAACLVIGFFIYLFFLNSNKNERLFNKYYEPYMIASVQRNEAVTGTRELAMQAYENGDYKQAVALFDSCLKSNLEDISCSFYLGLSFIERNQIPEAERYLKQVINQPANDFSDRARWYLALVYLKGEKTEAATSLLQELTREQGFYGQNATRLLKEL